MIGIYFDFLFSDNIVNNINRIYWAVQFTFKETHKVQFSTLDLGI